MIAFAATFSKLYDEKAPMIMESNPKLLETFADTSIAIERDEIELAHQPA
jgi:hypothetical protein